MTWKCPKCSYKSTDYKAVQKHYGKTHGRRSLTKGNQTKVFTYKVPKKGPKRR